MRLGYIVGGLAIWCDMITCALASSGDAPAGGTGYFPANAVVPDTMSITTPNIEVDGGTPNYYEGHSDTTRVEVVANKTAVEFEGRLANSGAAYNVYGHWTGGTGEIGGSGPNKWDSDFFPNGVCGVSISASPSVIACGDTGTATVTISSQSCQHGQHSVTLGSGDPEPATQPVARVSYPDGTSVQLAANRSASKAFRASDAPGYVSATASGDNLTPPTARAAVTVVTVKRLQYMDNGSWKDTPSPFLYVMKGTSVAFRVLPNPDGAPWPTGKLVWGDSASGEGPTAMVKFDTMSSDILHPARVSVECGAYWTYADVIVYELYPTLRPDDDFIGRSINRLGLRETAALGFASSPSLDAAQIGGLSWARKGVGAITATATDGTAVYNALYTAGACQLSLAVQTGPSKGMKLTEYDVSVVPPSGGYCSLRSNVWHQHNLVSIGIMSDFYILPKDVSFWQLKFKEGDCPSQTSGWFDRFAQDHTAREQGWTWMPIGTGNSNWGCKVQLPPTFDCASFTEKTPHPPYSAGMFTWLIPWLYAANAQGGGVREICKMDHTVQLWNGGTTWIGKGGAMGTNRIDDGDRSY